MIDCLRVNIVRWSIWFQGSVNRRIFISMVTVGGFTGMAYLATIFKDLVVAYRFGRGDEMDAFLIAFLLPSAAMNVVAGSFHPVLIPPYMQVRERDGEEAAYRLLANSMGLAVLLLAALSVVLALGAPFFLSLLGSGFGDEKAALTRSLFFVLLPVLILGGLVNLWMAILNAQQRFALPSASAAAIPIGTLAALFLLRHLWGVYALALGTLGGFALQAGLLASALRRRGLPVLPYWYGLDRATRQVISQYLPMLAGALLMSGTSLIDQGMAAMLGAGSVSAISYGNKFVALISGIGALVLSSVMLPHFSQMVAVNDWLGVRKTLRTYIGLILMITIPVTLLLVYLSDSLVALIFERGAFTQTDTHLVGRVQAFYLLQVPFYMVGILGVRLLNALRKNQTLMVLSGVVLIANAAGNYLLMQFWGVAGIALSTSIAYMISTGLIFLSLSRQIRRHEGT